MIHVDFKILVFIAAARHLNFTRAAKELNISQPAVSKNIHELEVQAGRNLFERNGHRLALSETGQMLLGHALRLTSVYEEMNTELEMLDGVLAGELRLGASTTLSNYILPQILTAFHMSYPKVGLKIFHGNSRDIEGLLSKKIIDLGIVEGLSDNLSMKYESFLKDEVVLVTRKGNPKLMGREILSPQHLLEFEYVLREQGSGTNDVVREALVAIGIDWQDLYVKVFLASVESIKSFLRETDCFSFISIHAIANELQSGELEVVEVENLRIDRDFYFMRPHGVMGYLPETFKRFALKRFSKHGIFCLKD